VPGTWDFVGILFAASGFLLVTGPAVISSGSESWRLFWLFGARAGIPAIDERAARIWSLLAIIYFATIVGVATYFLRRRRGLTAIYNVESEAFEKAMELVLGSLGLEPLRSGNLYVFGTGSAFATLRRNAIAIQAPHHLPASSRQLTGEEFGAREIELVSEAAVLEVDPFRLMRHITLRWEPTDTSLRREVEAELERAFAQTTPSDNPVGDWLILIALALIGFNLLATFGLTLSNFLHR
jgi:hypothetical protein